VCVGGGGGGSHSSAGGGAAFAQMTVRVKGGDVYSIRIAGGGTVLTYCSVVVCILIAVVGSELFSGGATSGEIGGQGGFNGGGKGGSSFGRSGGGGGGKILISCYSTLFMSLAGGCTTVSLNGVVVLVAAGGGGGGSTDYCCADGGAGGGAQGTAGLYPGSSTPIPISEPGALTPVLRRYQYTSFSCPNTTGQWCISEWDVLPHSMPALHVDLEYGQTPQGDYSAWSISGQGGSQSAGGVPGASGSYGISRSTNQLVPYGDGSAVIFTLIDGIVAVASPGQSLQGGSGADGHDAGGTALMLQAVGLGFTPCTRWRRSGLLWWGWRRFG
jgi:hypothetical protein